MMVERLLRAKLELYRVLITTSVQALTEEEVHILYTLSMDPDVMGWIGEQLKKEGEDA